jgi:hypothetical protein
MRSLGNNVSNYPNPLFYSGKHDKAYLSSEIDNPTTKGHTKSQSGIPGPSSPHPEANPQKSIVVKYKPFLSFKQIGRDELIYYHLKSQKFASQANAQNATDFSQNNKGRSLKKLPQLKKDLATAAQRLKITQIQTNNQCLPSLYLDYSRAIGRKSMPNPNQQPPDPIQAPISPTLQIIHKDRHGYKENYSSGGHWKNFWNVGHGSNEVRVEKGTKRFEEKQRGDGYWSRRCGGKDIFFFWGNLG